MRSRLKVLWVDVRGELRRSPGSFLLTLGMALILVLFALFDKNFESEWKETKKDE